MSTKRISIPYEPRPYQDDLTRRLNLYRFVVAVCHRRFGKALDINTPVPKADGTTTTMGQLKPGDLLVSSDGTPTTVVQVHPIQYNRPCYEVTLQNGDKIVADEDHLWSTTCKKDRHNPVRTPHGRINIPRPPQPRTTKEIYNTLRSRVEFNHQIPTVQPVEYCEQHLLLDPYILGVWLGDGASRAPYVTTMDREVKTELEAYAVLTNQLVAPISYQNAGKATTYKVTPLLSHVLRGLNVLGNKHIPTPYLRGSIEQRYALLQGLMDTDGTINKAGNFCEITQKNSRLASGIIQLLRSLGMAPKEAYKIVRKEAYHRITFRPNMNPFRIKRKSDRYVDPPDSYYQQSIVDVKPVSSRPVRCITVDSEDSLYAVGSGFTLTHNTIAGVMWLILEALSPNNPIPGFRGYYIAPNAKQAKRLTWNYFKKFLKNFGSLVTFNETELRITFHLQDDEAVIYLTGAENIESLRGIYADRVVLDEVASWENPEYAFFEVLFPAMSDRNGKGFIIGTVKGLDLFHEFYQFGQDKKLYPEWDSIIYDIATTSIFTPEQIATLKAMMRPDAYDREYGCNFYAEVPDRLLSPGDVNEALLRSAPDHVVKAAPEVWGFDVGYTGDPSVLIKRKGPLCRPPQTLDNKDSTYQGMWLKTQIDLYHPKALYIDAGYGEGVIAKLNDLGYGHVVIPIFFNNTSPSPNCVNMRAYMYWILSKWVKGPNSQIPNDKNLIKQLSNILLDDSDKSNRILLRPKKEIRLLLRMSPNESDALALTMAGGDEDSLDLEDILKDKSISEDNQALRTVLRAYMNDSYDPDNFMSSLSDPIPYTVFD